MSKATNWAADEEITATLHYRDGILVSAEVERRDHEKGIIGDRDLSDRLKTPQEVADKMLEYANSARSPSNFS